MSRNGTGKKKPEAPTKVDVVRANGGTSELPLEWSPEGKAFIEQEVRRELRGTAASMWRLGRLFHFAAVHMETKTALYDWVRDEFNLGRTWVSYCIAVYRLGDIPQLMDGSFSKSKAVGLLDFDDESIEHVRKHGTLPDVPRDDFDRMSATQLRNLARQNKTERIKGTEQLTKLRETVRERNDEIIRLKRGERPLPKDLAGYKGELADCETRVYSLIDDLKRLAAAAQDREQASVLRGAVSEYESLFADLWEHGLFDLVAEHLGGE